MSTERPRRRTRAGSTPALIPVEEQEPYPPEPHWGTDERGRFRYADYDGEQLVIRIDKSGDLWVDKLGEGPVYIRKEHIQVIIEALEAKP